MSDKPINFQLIILNPQGKPFLVLDAEKRGQQPPMPGIQPSAPQAEAPQLREKESAA